MLPTGHPAYEYIWRLRNRGYLPTINPLVQPIRRGEVARELARMDPDTLPSPVRSWVRWLQREVLPGPAQSAEGPRWGADGYVGIRASSGNRLDPIRAEGRGGVWPRYSALLWVEAGRLALSSGIELDRFLDKDPDGLDVDFRRGGRADQTYVNVRTGAGTLTLGRFRRNWGPPGTPGLLVSDIPPSYPQAGWELRLGRFVLRSFTAELDTIEGAKRFLAAHRLDYERPDFVLSFGEAILYGGGSGGPSVRYAIPTALLVVDQGKHPDRVLNLLLDLQLWFRREWGSVTAEFLLDDVDILNQPRDPTQYAVRGEVRGLLAPGAEVRLRYTRVAGWTYRTLERVDRYVFLERGLGENYVDFERWDLALELFPSGIPDLLLSPGATLLRQGEGELREPDIEALGFRPGGPGMFLRGVERRMRLWIRARWSPGAHWVVGGDVGWQRSTRDGSRPDSGFSAVGTVHWVF